MRAAYYETPGAAAAVLVVGEVETPSPAAGEVLVRVAYSSVHPSDVKLRAGGRPGAAGLPYPRIIPHSDGSGTIEAVGAGVDAARIGERVWLWNGQWERASGTCAEYIALPSEQAVKLPDNVSLEDAACLGIPAVTAHACLMSDGPVDGQTILITGGAGAVSWYAIQMARREGATVITTVSSPEKAAYAKKAGAQHCINYREEDLVARVTEITGGRGLDRVVDLEFGANIDAVAQLIRVNGTIVAYGSAAVREPVLPFYTLMFKRVTLKTELVYLLPETERRMAETYLNRALEENGLTHSIYSMLPLEDTARAHEKVESGDRLGCVLITL